MKLHSTIFALATAVILTSCAGVRVRHTDVASGAVNPRAIYIRPFTVSEFRGQHGTSGERAIRKSIAPAEFASILKQELEKIAPAMVIADDEAPTNGWIVEGNFDLIHAGSPTVRAATGGLFGLGGSRVILHVRIIDVGESRVVADAKQTADGEAVAAASSRSGTVIYEFDLSGGSRGTGKLGSLTAPGLGYAVPFDFRNAAERIYMVLTPDPHRYGVRVSPTIR